MRHRMMTVVALGGILAVLTACSSPPDAAIDAAKDAFERASAASAAEYAPDAYAEAGEAQVALDTELKRQADSLSIARSYATATELATAGRELAEQAEQDATAGREAAKRDAPNLIAGAKEALTKAHELVSKVLRSRVAQENIEALKTDLAGAETAISEAENAFASERFKEVRAKAEASRALSAGVAKIAEQALAGKKVSSS